MSITLTAELVRDARDEALEEAAQWHETEIARLDDIEAYPPGLTEYGKDNRRWHVRARDAIRALKSSTPTQD
jgi:hypothetical protein